MFCQTGGNSATTRRIAQAIKLPSHFAALAPKVREFFERKAFVKVVDLSDKSLIPAMSSNVASYVVLKEFEKALRGLVLESREPRLLATERLLSATPPFPTSKKVLEAKKCVFNHTPCDNDFECNFARFLDAAKDVRAFAKLPEQFGFCIQYTDAAANVRNYFPDFIVETKLGEKWLVETKGREDVTVALKDNAAKNWCVTAEKLTGVPWNYIKVPQDDYEGLKPENFDELTTGLISPEPRGGILN
jgi:type III restriction enzyme